MTGVAAFSVALMLNRACCNGGILSVKRASPVATGHRASPPVPGASSLRHRLTRPYLGWRASPAFPAWPPDRFLPMRPRRQRAFSAHQGWKTAGPARPGSRRPAHGRSDPARAEGGGSGRVENKIASVVGCAGFATAGLPPALLPRKRQPAGGHQAPARVRVSQYASGMNRSGNAAVGRQIVKNRGQLPGIAHITTADARLPALHVA